MVTTRKTSITILCHGIDKNSNQHNQCHIHVHAVPMGRLVEYCGVYCFPVFSLAIFFMAWYKSWYDIGLTDVENFRSKQSRLGCMLCHFIQEAKNIKNSPWTYASFKCWKTYFLMNKDQSQHYYYLPLYIVYWCIISAGTCNTCQ